MRYAIIIQVRFQCDINKKDESKLEYFFMIQRNACGAGPEMSKSISMVPFQTGSSISENTVKDKIQILQEIFHIENGRQVFFI